MLPLSPCVGRKTSERSSNNTKTLTEKHIDKKIHHKRSQVESKLVCQITEYTSNTEHLLAACKSCERGRKQLSKTWLEAIIDQETTLTQET